MASAEQLKALLKSHIEGDEGHFFSVAMQLAAQEDSELTGKTATGTLPSLSLRNAAISTIARHSR